jgi:hypothetical protein
MDWFAYGFIPINQPKIDDVIIHSCAEFHSAVDGVFEEFQIVVKLNSDIWDFCEFISKIKKEKH